MPLALVGGWLVFLTARQVELFPPAAEPATELVPASLVGGLVAVVTVVRVARPSLGTHIGFLTAVTVGLALLAAQLGQPLANATADYCGDQCRTAIIGRFVAFFGWPILAAVALWLVVRSERRDANRPAVERAAWTRAWAIVTLVAGSVAGVAWWRIILPNG